MATALRDLHSIEWKLTMFINTRVLRLHCTDWKSSSSENHFIICRIRIPDKVTRRCKLVCMIQLAELFVRLVVKTKTGSRAQAHHGTI